MINLNYLSRMAWSTRIKLFHEFQLMSPTHKSFNQSVSVCVCVCVCVCVYMCHSNINA